MTREEILTHPVYWFDHEQNELFRQLSDYMERENINKTEMAKKLNVSKGYISQILNGDSNFSLKKLIELSLSIGKVPQIKYADVKEIIKQDKIKKDYLDNAAEANTIIPIAFHTVCAHINFDDRKRLPKQESLTSKLIIGSYTKSELSA